MHYSPENQPLLIMNKIFLFLCLSVITNGNFVFANETLSSLEHVELIRSVALRLNCKCVIFLSDNLYEDIAMEKLLYKVPQFYIGIWNYETFYRNLYSRELPTTKTLIVMRENQLNLKKISLISTGFRFSSFVWLTLSTVNANIFSRFKEVTIPINCQFIVSTKKENGFVTLYVLYKISWDSELIQKKFSIWSLKDGLNSSPDEIFSERMNLRGHKFRYAVHDLTNETNPCEAVHIDNGKQMIQCAHFDVWNNLGKVLNYTTKYVVIEDCYKKGNTGLSTPMLEMIRTGGADSGEDGYIWSSSRLLHNQFFWPLYHSRVILVTKVPSRKFSFSSYVRQFNSNMWLALTSWLFLSGVIITFSKFIARKYIFERKPLIVNESTEYLFLPLAAICYQSSSTVPKNAAIRIAYLMIYLIPVLLIPSYSGSIISSLSVPSENVPFNDLDEFEKDGSYQLNAINNTFFQFFLLTDETFENVRQKKLVSNAMTVSYEQSFRDICSKKVTFMYEWPLLTKYSINCNVFKFDLPLKKIFSSMAVPKFFPYLELFNRQMQRLIAAGLHIKILEKNTLKLFKHKVNPFPQNYFQIKPFQIGDVLPLFAVLAVGMSLSLFLILIEIYITKLKTIESEIKIKLFKNYKMNK